MKVDPVESLPPPRRRREWARRTASYALACLLVVLAVVTTRSLATVLGESISPLFFAAVMLSAWFGGMGPGLLATALSGWASAYYFPNNPPGSTFFGWDDGIRLSVFLMVSLLISSLTSLRQRAQDALRRSYLELERRVRQRTQDLSSLNERLKESEERFRVLVDGVEDYAIVMLDPNGRVLSWNGGAGRIEGYSQDEMVGQPVSRFFLPADVASGESQRHLAVAAALGRHEDEGWRVRKDGVRFTANVITTALRTESGDLRGFAQVTRDVTELRRLERAVLEIGEAERRRIGHDLHDGLGQQLTGVALLTQNLAARLREHSAKEVVVAQRILDEVNGAIGQTRDLARGLSPVEMGPGGLRAAVLNLAAQMEAAGGAKVRVECDVDLPVDDETALHLYRIAQEALSNALRHGQASVVEIALAATPAGVTLRVADDGVGIARDDAMRGGMGICVMKYRARMIGATLDVRRREPAGTEVVCVGPRAEPRTTDGEVESEPIR